MNSYLFHIDNLEIVIKIKIKEEKVSNRKSKAGRTKVDSVNHKPHQEVQDEIHR